MNVSKRRGSAMALALAVVAAVVIVVGWGAASVAQAAIPAASTAAQRQMRGEIAAKAFVQGHYEEALSIYLDLYAQSGGRPEYLRNIGRCQQKMNRHEPAIESFKEYLRKGKNLSGEEKAEIQGFIAEVQAARAASATPPAPPPAPSSPQPPPAAAAPPVVAPPSPVAPPAPVPQSPYDYPGAGTVPPAELSPPGAPPAQPPQTVPPPWAAPPPPAPGHDSSPSPSSGLKVGGVVALIGAGVLGLVGALALVSANSTYDEGLALGCKNADRPATCAGKADSIETMNTLSKVMFVGAGLAGAAGATMLILAPGPAGEPRVAIGARYAF